MFNRAVARAQALMTMDGSEDAFTLAESGAGFVASLQRRMRFPNGKRQQPVGLEVNGMGTNTAFGRTHDVSMSIRTVTGPAGGCDA